jgi:hypothetical protein
MEIGGCAQELSDVACDDTRARGEAFPATLGKPTRNGEIRCQPEQQTVKHTGLTPPALSGPDSIDPEELSRAFALEGNEP